ncbi:MAG: hypothetical protein R3C11_02590 [Planctomycetaceae bacterium]
MSAEKSDQESTFDLEKFRELVELMEKHDLSDVSLKCGEQHWRVKRGAEQVMPSFAMPPMQAVPQAPLAPPAPSAAAPAAAEAPLDANTRWKSNHQQSEHFTTLSPDDPSLHQNRIQSHSRHHCLSR